MISYDIIGEEVFRALSSGASKYFQIDRNTGAIYLTQSVLNTDIQSFVVCYHLSVMLFVPKVMLQRNFKINPVSGELQVLKFALSI